MKKYVVALDQGTTSSRAVLVNHEGQIEGISQMEFAQHFPQPGWVEHDPLDILSSQLSVFTELLVSQGLTVDDLSAVGITNQRETVVVWDKHTGEPVHNAIVWQCRRTAELVDRLCGDPGVAEKVTQLTGLIPDAYYSASKVAWILDHVDGARERAQAGDLLMGTVDTWLIWNFTDHQVHATDPTNASRTMLYDITKGEWSPWLCQLFGIPESMLPEVRPSSGNFGTFTHPVIAGSVPICGVAGDQQSALFGQCCFEAGEAKSTFGTGCFLLMNIGSKPYMSTHGLATTVAASAPGTQGLEYALEGSVFMAGALMQWLRDGLGLLEDVADSQELAESVPDSAGVYVVPAFTGLGAPYWDADARGAIFGLTRGATKAHLVRACLEAQAFQVHDVLNAMAQDSGISLGCLNVDGGAVRNGFMLQNCANILGLDIVRPTNVETTALGAAYLAGLSSGFWQNVEQIKAMRGIDRVFTPNMDPEVRQQALAGWDKAVARTRS